MYSSKKSQEYILLSAIEQKTAFSAIYKPKLHQTACFLPFSLILGGMGAYLSPLTPSTTTPGPGTPLLIVVAPTSF
jgi:hypothetical protein